MLTFAVDTRDYQRGDRAAAQALWAVCSATVGGDVSGVPTPAEDAVDDGYTVTISPAIGENGRKRLVGCLEDAALDRVMATSSRSRPTNNTVSGGSRGNQNCVRHATARSLSAVIDQDGRPVRPSCRRRLA